MLTLSLSPLFYPKTSGGPPQSIFSLPKMSDPPPPLCFVIPYYMYFLGHPPFPFQFLFKKKNIVKYHKDKKYSIKTPISETMVSYRLHFAVVFLNSILYRGFDCWFLPPSKFVNQFAINNNRYSVVFHLPNHANDKLIHAYRKKFR